MNKYINPLGQLNQLFELKKSTKNQLNFWKLYKSALEIS